MDANDVIDGAIDYINKNGWCQGELTAPGGQACMRGAMMVGAGAELVHHVGGTIGINANPMDWDAFMDATRMVERQINESVPFWNDEPTTSLEDVMLVLKRAKED